MALRGDRDATQNRLPERWRSGRPSLWGGSATALTDAGRQGRRVDDPFFSGLRRRLAVRLEHNRGKPVGGLNRLPRGLL